MNTRNLNIVTAMIANYDESSIQAISNDYLQLIQAAAASPKLPNYPFTRKVRGGSSSGKDTSWQTMVIIALIVIVFILILALIYLVMQKRTTIKVSTDVSVIQNPDQVRANAEELAAQNENL